MAYTRSEDYGRYGESPRRDGGRGDDHRGRDYGRERRGASSDNRYGSPRGDDLRYEEWQRAGGDRYAGEGGEEGGWRSPDDYGASGVGGGSRPYDPYHSGMGYGRDQREGGSSAGRRGGGEYRGPYGQGDYGSEGYGSGRGTGPSRDRGSVSSGYSEPAGGRDSFYGTRYSAAGGGYSGDYNRRYGADQAGGSMGGATGQYRGKGPKGYTRSDERIKEEVCDCLADDSNLDASEISVEVKDGEVTLTGTVGDRESKRWAEDLVERSSGVKNVQNNLRVSSDHDRSGSGSSMYGSNASGSTAAGGRGKSMQN